MPFSLVCAAKAQQHLAVGRALPNNFLAPRPLAPPGTKGVGGKPGRGRGRGRGRGAGSSGGDAGMRDDPEAEADASSRQAHGDEREGSAAAALAAADDQDATSTPSQPGAAIEPSEPGVPPCAGPVAETQAPAQPQPPSVVPVAEPELGPVRPPLEPEWATLPNGQKVIAQMARPFLAMLPLSDQTNAKDGHVLMMPVRLSYLTMATLLAHPPITAPFMTAANARELREAMEALVRSGQLRVSHTPDGPTVGYLPGCEPPKLGERAPPPLPRDDDDQVLGFQRAARDALRKQIDDETLVPQIASLMADLGANEPVYPPPSPLPPPPPVRLESKPRQPRAPKSKLALHEAIAMNAVATAQAMPMARLQASQHAAAQAVYAHHMGAARMETSMQMAAQAEMVRQQEEMIRQQQQYAASVGTDQQPSTLQPQVTRRLTWQEHLVGWQIQAEQYTSGARTHTCTARSMFALSLRTHVSPPERANCARSSCAHHM